MTNFIGASKFGDEVFSNDWIIVTDNNNCDVPVAIEDFMQDKPTDNRIYEKVYYYGQVGWILKELHFPV